MIVIEMTGNTYGEAMKAITCIEHKLSMLKAIFDSETEESDTEETETTAIKTINK